jgi:hypothetical protein
MSSSHLGALYSYSIAAASARKNPWLDIRRAPFPEAVMQFQLESVDRVDFPLELPSRACIHPCDAKERRDTGNDHADPVTRRKTLANDAVQKAQGHARREREQISAALPCEVSLVNELSAIELDATETKSIGFRASR